MASGVTAADPLVPDARYARPAGEDAHQATFVCSLKAKGAGEARVTLRSRGPTVAPER